MAKQSTQTPGPAYRGNYHTPEHVSNQPLRTPERTPETGKGGPSPVDRDKQPTPRQGR